MPAVNFVALIVVDDCELFLLQGRERLERLRSDASNAPKPMKFADGARSQRLSSSPVKLEDIGRTRLRPFLRQSTAPLGAVHRGTTPAFEGRPVSPHGSQGSGGGSRPGSAKSREPQPEHLGDEAYLGNLSAGRPSSAR
jgi:hypothetical protein